MKNDTIWYVTLTVLLAVSTVCLTAILAFRNPTQTERVELACIHAHGQMADSVCVFGGAQ